MAGRPTQPGGRLPWWGGESEEGCEMSIPGLEPELGAV